MTMNKSQCGLSRRQLLSGLIGLAAAPSILQGEPLFLPTELNHVTLNVSDLEKSRRFYSKLFGGPQWLIPPNQVSFDLGMSPLSIYLANVAGNPTGVAH
jgi:hypothetical protein